MNRARNAEKFTPILAMNTAYWSTGSFSLEAREASSKSLPVQ